MDENVPGDWMLTNDATSPYKPDRATASDAASTPESEQQQLQHVEQPQWSYEERPIVPIVPPPQLGVPLPRPRFNSLAEAFAPKPQQGEAQPGQPPPPPKQPLQNGSSAANMSNGPPIPGSPLASPQSQLSQGYDGMVPPASPFPPHMQQYNAHSSPVPMSASPVMSVPPHQSPVMSPVPNSVGGGGGGPGPGMYQQPPTPQRSTMPQGMPLTPGGGMQMVPPGTPGGCGPMTPHPMNPMTPQSQQQMQQQQQQMMQQQAQMQQMQQGQQMTQQQMAQQQMQQQQMQMQQMQGQPQMMPGQPQMQQQMIVQPMQPQGMQPGMQPGGMQPNQMMGMGPQGQMMMQGQQPYYPMQPGQQWGQQQMMPPQFVRKPTMMGAAAMQGGAPPQRVMIQRVPYPPGTGYPPGTMAPQQAPPPQQMQQQMPTGPQYAVRPMPPQYPPMAGQPGVPSQPPGYGYPQGTMPAQSPVPYPGGTTVPGGMQPMQPGAVPPQYPQQQQQQRQQLQQPQQQPQPGQQQQMQMRPYMQSPQGQQMMAANQQPVYPQSVPPQQQQQQVQPGTPQTPFTPNAPRYPPGTPTNSSPLHGTPQQLQQQQLLQQQQGAGGPPGTPGTPVQQQQQLAPDMRSPQLLSPSQAQMMQAQQQTQPMMHPTARQMSNSDMQMRPMPQQQQVQQMPQQVPVMQPMQQMVAPPQMVQPLAPYLARDPSQQPPPAMSLVGCHIVVLDWERYTTERTDQGALKTMVRSLGGDIDFGMKAYDSQRLIVTHGIISFLLFPRPPGPPSPVEHTLHLMIKEGKRVVTMQWLVDVIDQKKMEVPWRIAHLPIPMPLEQMRTNHGRIVSVSGFPEGERGAVKYMVEAIGAKIMPGLTQHTHLLVAKNPSSEKFEKAREWGVPIVNLQWLVDAYLGQPRLDLEHPRYQVSSQSPIEISCGSYTLEMLHDSYKHCLNAWRNPISFVEEQWQRALASKQEVEFNEKIFPLKKLKLNSSPAPSEEEISAAHESEPPTADRRQIVVAFEGFDEELEAAMGRKIRMMGGEVTDEVEKCSHLVAVDGKRTVNLLKALALGKNLVVAQWVNTSYDEKQFADTLDFFLHDDESERMHCCNLKLSVMRARKSRVFEDCEFYITPSVDPSPDIVRNIIELAGGLVHANPPSPAKIIECMETDKPYIMVATECDMPILKYLTDAGCSVYSTEFIFSAVMKQEVEIHPSYIVAPNSCAPAPLRLPPMGGAAPVSAGCGGGGASSAASTPSRRTSTGYAATPPGPVPLTPTQTAQIEFASPQTPRIKAN